MGTFSSLEPFYKCWYSKNPGPCIAKQVWKIIKVELTRFVDLWVNPLTPNGRIALWTSISTIYFKPNSDHRWRRYQQFTKFGCHRTPLQKHIIRGDPQQSYGILKISMHRISTHVVRLFSSIFSSSHQSKACVNPLHRSKEWLQNFAVPLIQNGAGNTTETSQNRTKKQ